MRPWMLIALLLPLDETLAAFFPGSGPQVPMKKSAASILEYDKAASNLLAFELEMSPLALQQGGHLHLVLEPDNPSVNAMAKRDGDDWNIVVYGGLLRHPAIHEAELTMVLCHELGHHLGGSPTAARDGWSACEGQADYWSTLACFGAIRPHDDGVNTALTLTQLYSSMGGGATPSLECQGSERPPRTWYGYPSPQCRLDTLLAGLQEGPRPRCWFVE